MASDRGLRSNTVSACACALALALAGCSGSEPKPKKKTAEAAAESAVRSFLRADVRGDYKTVCSMFTTEARQVAAKEHAPGENLGCEAAFESEAEVLGESLEDANEIDRNTRIVSVIVRNDGANVTVDRGGGSGPATYELEKVGGRWLIAEEG